MSQPTNQEILDAIKALHRDVEQLRDHTLQDSDRLGERVKKLEEWRVHAEGNGAAVE